MECEFVRTGHRRRKRLLHYVLFVERAFLLPPSHIWPSLQQEDQSPTLNWNLSSSVGSVVSLPKSNALCYHRIPDVSAQGYKIASVLFAVK